MGKGLLSKDLEGIERLFQKIELSNGMDLK